MAGDKGLVCVTGGTGYIASWLIMKLLQNGYHVRATVRPDTGKSRISWDKWTCYLFAYFYFMKNYKDLDHELNSIFLILIT